MKIVIKIFSIIIGISLCLIVILKVYGKLESINYNALDFIIILVGIAFIFIVPTLLFETSSFKFMDFEWKREIAEVKKNLRQYVILNEKGEIIKSTFPKGQIKIIDFKTESQINIWFKRKPIYLEIRGINSVSSYKVDSENFKDGVLFRCYSETTIFGSKGNENIAEGFIIESYID